MALAQNELQQWMSRLADGDRGAFHPVFEVLWPVVSTFVRRQLDHDSDDVAQEALVKVFERAAEFNPERDAWAWVLGITAFEIRTARKRRLRRREDSDAALTSLADGEAGPEERAILRDLEQAALDVLGSLRPIDRETLLSLAQGKRLRGATFRKRLQRSLERVRAAWRARHGA